MLFVDKKPENDLGWGRFVKHSSEVFMQYVGCCFGPFLTMNLSLSDSSLLFTAQIRSQLGMVSRARSFGAETLLSKKLV